ncbi:MAG TPA: hypothetical protein VFG91_10150 [Woeseiaceae bacterium]|nr:hypothetical protein [Woeseiaceae bacterium]
MVNRRIGFSGVAAGNPLVNALLVVVGVIAMGAMVVLGVVAFLVVASILVVLAGIVGLRLWWIGRKLRKASGGAAGPFRTDKVIEGEYRRVPTGTERERHDRHDAS